MATHSISGSTGKQITISLHGLSHEVCVAVTQVSYWQQLIRNSNISIVTHGKYVPIELERIYSDQDEPTLHLIIQSQSEQDNQQFDRICTRIRYDLISFENNDRPIYDHENHLVVVFGSLYNSLPENLFETERNLLGQRHSNIKKIRTTLACSIEIDSSIPQRYRFTIHHEKQMIMDLAAIEIQGLVKQAQIQYMIAFANSIGRTLIGPMEQMEITAATLTDPHDFPSYKSFQPASKRRRDDDEQSQQQRPLTTIGQANTDSDRSDDESTPDDRRQQRRDQVDILLNQICERMQARTPKDQVAKLREDSSQIKSYFRQINPSKTSTGTEADFSIELVEHEIDLRTRGFNEHKCTLVFNKLLKMGVGARDRLKKTAKVRAYEKLKTMTRDTPRENLVIKPTRDGLWKVVNISSNNQ